MSERVTRKQVLGAAGAVGGAVAGVAGVAGGLRLLLDEADAGTALLAAHVRGALPQDDPGSLQWEETNEVAVPLLPQRLAPPYLDEPGVEEVRVRALHNGTDVAFRVRWADDTVDNLDGVGRFHDAVAVMLPTAPGVAGAITMGAEGQPVHILQWRATWQRDLAGRSGVDQLYPRVEHDVMPDDVLPAETAELYHVGRAAGNPLSQARRTTPIEQMVAEGFGTTTHLPSTSAQGRGVHDGSGWTVALGCPAARDGIGAPLRPGERWSVAFAVWLGDRQNRGGRKHYANWVPLSLELVT